MSPQKKKKLNILRKRLDTLDNSFLILLKKRAHIVQKVLNLKDHKKQIVDQKRIKIILKSIKKKSIKIKLDPKITNRIGRNMIWSFIDFERRNFKKK